MMCRVFGVSRSGSHASASRPPSKRAVDDERLLERIREIHETNRKVYGSPRIHAELVLGDGEQRGRKARRAPHAPGRHHRPAAQEARADDDPGAGRARLRGPRRPLVSCRGAQPPVGRVLGARLGGAVRGRSFLRAPPPRLGVADITLLRAWDGWLYLVAVQGLFGRRIVGWWMAHHMRPELVPAALQMALARRRPD